VTPELYETVGVSPTITWTAIPTATSYTVAYSKVSIDGPYTFINNITTTSHTLTSLEHASAYWIYVQAHNAAGSSIIDGTTGSIFYTNVVMPDVPVLTSPANNATNAPMSIIMTWSPAANAKHYELQVSLLSDFSVLEYSTFESIVGTSKDLVVIRHNTTYYWRVRSVAYHYINTSDNYRSEWSEVFAFTTVKAAPIVPTLLTPDNEATGVSITPTLTWNAAAYAESYAIQVAQHSGFMTSIAVNTTTTATSFTTPELNANTVYYWRVKSINTNAESAWSDVRSFRTNASASVKIIPNGVIKGHAKVYVKVAGETVSAENLKIKVNTETETYNLVATAGNNEFISVELFNVRKFNSGNHTVTLLYNNTAIATSEFSSASLLNNNTFMFNGVKLTGHGNGEQVLMLNPENINGISLQITGKPFEVHFENKSAFISVENTLGNKGVLLRYHNGIWEMVAHSKRNLYIKESGVYALAKDNNNTMIPKIHTSAVSQNYPNPFNPETDIDISVAKTGHVSVTVFNSRGKKIVDLHNGILNEGINTIHWNGKDSNSKDMPSGVYYAVIIIDGVKLTRKMVMLK